MDPFQQFKELERNGFVKRTLKYASVTNVDFGKIGSSFFGGIDVRSYLISNLRNSLGVYCWCF